MKYRRLYGKEPEKTGATFAIDLPRSVEGIRCKFDTVIGRLISREKINETYTKKLDAVHSRMKLVSKKNLIKSVRAEDMFRFNP